MKIRAIGQGYNLTINSSVAEELLIAFSDNEYNKFSCLVAFASKAGVSGLAPHVQKSKVHIKDFHVIVGIDQKGTSKEALEELLAWDVGACIYFSPQRNIFHPKIFLFEGENKSLLIAGSNNLTQMGLVQNIEFSIAIEFDKGDKEGNDLVSQLKLYYESLFQATDPNLKIINQDLINRLTSAGIVPLESERRLLYGKVRNNKEKEIESKNNKDLGDLFTSTPLQGFPPGFVPRRTKSDIDKNDNINPNENGGNLKEINDKSLGENSDPISLPPSTSWEYGDLNEVLVAELSGPERWAQANFDKSSFEDFFGATIGGPDYYISLRFVDHNGQVGSPVLSKAVSVQSQNHRFELRAANLYTYPIGGIKPIGIFIKVSNDRFVYNLAIPGSSYFDELRTFLTSTYRGRRDRNFRITTTVGILRTSCPSLPFWPV